MKLGLGTVQFGILYGINNKTGIPGEGEISKILKLASLNDIEYLDTARAYGNSELALGLQNLNNFKVVTKLNPHINHLTATGNFNQSLINLKVKNTYGLLLHRIEDYIADRKVWSILQNLRKENKVEKIGFSIYDPQQLDVVFNTDCNLIQIPFNFFDRRFEPYLKEIKNRNIEIHVRSIFLQGLFFKNPLQLSNNLKVFKKDLNFLQNEFQTIPDLMAFLIQFIDSYNSIDIAMVGVETVNQLTEIIQNRKKEFVYNNSLIRRNHNFKSINHKFVNPSLWN